MYEVAKQWCFKTIYFSLFLLQAQKTEAKLAEGVRSSGEESLGEIPLTIGYTSVCVSSDHRV